MSKFFERFVKLCKSGRDKSITAGLLKYVTDGDKAALKKAVKGVGGHSWQLYFLDDLWPQLPPPAEQDEEERRAMEAAVALGLEDKLAEWVQTNAKKHPDLAEAYLNAFVGAYSKKQPARVAANLLRPAEYLETDGQPNLLGQYVLDRSDEELIAAGNRANFTHDALKFLIKHTPQRLAKIASGFLREGAPEYRAVSSENCRLLLEQSKSYESIIADAVNTEKKLRPKVDALQILDAHFPEKYKEQCKQECLKIIAHHDYGGMGGVACYWLADTYGAAIVPEALPALQKSREYHVHGSLDAFAEKLGDKSAPLMAEFAKDKSTYVRLTALSQLVQWKGLPYDDLIEQQIIAGFDSEDPERFIKLGGGWQPHRFQESFWKLFQHKTKTLRMAAVRALLKADSDAVKTAISFLDARKAAIRAAAVSLLTMADDPRGHKAMEARLEEETDEAVRDQILLALESIWEAQGKKITAKQIQKRIDRVAEQLNTPLVKWLKEDQLPALRYAKGKKELPLQTVRYLLYRQSRAKEIRPDVEAKPLFALINHNASGDFALAVLEMFLESKKESGDRWALTIAGVLGDDRVVAPLMKQIRSWTDSNRGKMAEYAASAIALVGSDVALCAVDALSIRYRSKQKNVGRAATEAFAEAAERQGLTPDELGDRVTPWLGFEPGQPRIIEEKDKKIEAQIGLNFKLEYRDLVKEKRIKSLPAAISAETKAEFKELAATLREIVKGQLARLENLMVRQYRWPVAAWRELYLVHPLLFPFAARLVWGVFDAKGKLTNAFRALEDRTLTDADDEAVKLPSDKSGAQFGVVHPLELTSAQRQAWSGHLADYEVVSPFLQMERPVIHVLKEEKKEKICTKYRGESINAMTFRGRAERLGWQRGSVVDAGHVSSYRKTFPGAGVEAILGLDGMYIGIDMYSEISLQTLMFVTAGSVQFGSYIYDEPSENQEDERVIAFGDTPAIVYSEVIADLNKIAGVNEKSAEPQ